MRVLGLLGVVCALALGLIGAAGAQPDPGFGSGGEVFFTNEDRTDVAIDDQGRIVTSGSEFGGAATVHRLLANGSSDPSFGVGGLVRDTLGSLFAISGAGALDSEGRVLIAGHTGGSRYVARFLANGARDPSFSGDGVAALGTNGSANELHVDHQDRPIVMDGSPVRLTRLTEDGELDESFGPGGILTTDIAFLGDFVVSGAGVITVAGSSINGAAELRRYLPNGTLDAAFGAGGRITLQIASSVQVWAVDFAPAGGLVIAGGGFVVTGGGGAPIVFTRHAIVARLTASGSLDPSFGAEGVAFTDAPANLPAFFFDVAVGSDGAVVAGGGWFDGPAAGRMIALLTPDGKPNEAFAVDGVLRAPLKPIVRRLRLDGSGRLVAVGSDNTGGFVARYLLPAADTTPPVIHVADVSADATGPGGASIQFDATATDGTVPLPVLCNPPSGSLFPIGDTVVSCEAADAAGNKAAASFVVHVRGAAEQFAALEADTPFATMSAKLDRIPKPVVHSRTTCLGLGFYAEAAGRRGLPELVLRARRISAVLAC